MVHQSSVSAETSPASSELPNREVTERSLRRLKIPYSALKHVLASVDAFMIVIASLFGSQIYQLAVNRELLYIDPLLGVGPVAALLYVLIGHSTGFYDLSEALSRGRRDIGRISIRWSLVGLLLALLAFLMKSGGAFSRGSVICFGLIALILLLVCRRFTKRWLAVAVSDGKVQGRRAVLLGTPDELNSMGSKELLERHGLSEVDRVTFSSERNGGLSMTTEEASSLERAIIVARKLAVDEIVLALPWSDNRKLELVRDKLRASPLPVRLLPDRRIRAISANPSFQVQSSLAVEIQRGPLTRTEQLIKRVFDLVGASIGLVILAPLMVISAVAIKLDSPGPVFFRQRRNGFNSNQFSIVKFRTMNVLEDGPVVVQASRFDTRITRVGKLLRRSSIDEVPQLLNVMRGDMSLVGPRPHALAHDSYYGNLLSDYAFRNHVKPGITGWAQIRGYRGETAHVEQMKGRVECDLWYINNWSLTLDFKIIALTCVALMFQRNAY
jgi:undecaprenyl-phosphate galactose phosphotransferase/putative colanic acid biosynthesis UDP-glucose lipid carrier transferase